MHWPSLGLTLADLLIAKKALQCKSVPFAASKKQLKAAEKEIAAFRKRKGPSVFTLLGEKDTHATVRGRYAKRLSELANDPRKLDQRQLNGCGMAAFLHIWLKRDPVAAVKYAIELYEHGLANIGTLDIAPSQDLLAQDYGLLEKKHNQTAFIMPEPTDWVMISALRDATGGIRYRGIPPQEEPENVVTKIAGFVLPEEFGAWMLATGLYTNVVNHTNIPMRRDLDDALMLQPAENRDIVVLMHTRMLNKHLADPDCGYDYSHKEQNIEGEIDGAVSNLIPNHYVVLNAPIDVMPNGNIRLCFWCWGDDLRVEKKKVGNKTVDCTCMPYETTRENFEKFYYGSVIAVK